MIIYVSYVNATFKLRHLTYATGTEEPQYLRHLSYATAIEGHYLRHLEDFESIYDTNY